MTLVTSTARPLELVEVRGVPEGFSDLLAAEVVAGKDTAVTYVERMDDGRVLLHAPIHPAGNAAGGQVMLRLLDREGRGCQPVPFTVMALPDGLATMRGLVQALDQLIGAYAIAHGISADELLQMHVDDLSDPLMAVRLAQSVVNDPLNPNSLAAIVDGSAPILDEGAIDLNLVGGLLGTTGLLEMLSKQIQDLEELRPQPATSAGSAGWTDARISASNGGVSSITTAAELDYYMRLAQQAAWEVDGPSGEYLRSITSVLGLGGLIPGWGKAFAVAGASIFSFQQLAEGASNLYPSKFVSMDFDLDPVAFREDDPQHGEWSNVQVVATSEGWAVEGAILGSMLQVAGMGKFGAWMDRFGAEHAATRVFTEFLIQEGVGKIIGGATQGTEFLHIPPKLTPSIDITEDPWTVARVSFALEKVDRQGYRLDASWISDYKAEVQVRTAEGRFGSGYIDKTYLVAIQPVHISISPRQIMGARPGDVVTFIVTVDAVDPRIDVDVTSGFSIHSDHGDGSHTIQYTVPAEDQLPVAVTATSRSTGGLLANIEQRARPSAFAVINSNIPPQLRLSPRPLCVEPDESIRFTATVGDEPIALADLDITVVNGSILPDGTFIPGDEGYATVEAQSRTDPDLIDFLEFPVGECMGRFRASFITEGYEAEFIGEALFGAAQSHSGRSYVTLGFDRMRPRYGSSGIYYTILDAVPSGMTGKTYALPVEQLTFTLHSENALYGAGNDDCSGSITITTADAERLQGSIGMTCTGHRITPAATDWQVQFSWMMQFDAQYSP